MTRPRSRARGLPDPVYRRSRPIIPTLLALAVSACIGAGTPAAEAPSTGALASAPAPSAAASSPAASATAVTTAAPLPTPTVVPIETPSGEPSASPTSGVGTVDGCTGTDDNRTFFANAAASFDWPVYCAVLPARWFVGTGSFSGARGGKLEITYKGPSGALLELHEGAFCTDGTGCVPEGSDSGTVAFGDRTATLVHFEDGRIAAVVDRGQRLSWLVIGTELRDDAFRAITADLIRLD